MIAFQFPGQGSQFAGMGQTLAATFPEARAIFDRADEALGFSLSTLCFEGPEDALKLTENTQPAILTASIAAWEVLKTRLQPAFVAGHSLGEYSALVAAGALSFEDAVRTVRKRGQYMQEAVPAGVGAMAALRTSEEAVQPILDQAAEGEVLTAANFNAPDQVVIAGHAGAVDRALKLARGIKLQVSAPFHCPLMQPAQERLAADLAQIAFHDLALPLVNNVRAELVTTGAAARQGLIDQVPNSVRWTATVRLLAEQGVTTFVEVGPKTVLSGLLKKIDATRTGLKFGEAADLEAILEATA
ncbi:MAG: ACP S-malonyltransferase [Acidobacteria bacterium]|nr:ACP S-malonyltransferase [Acidobacteriota bacterium]